MLGFLDAVPGSRVLLLGQLELDIEGLLVSRTLLIHQRVLMKDLW